MTKYRRVPRRVSSQIRTVLHAANERYSASGTPFNA